MNTEPVQEAIELQPRDVRILGLIGEHRFLSTDQIHTLVAPDRDLTVVQRRLRKLYRNGYVRRDRHPGEADRELLGSKPRVYSLAYRGATELARRGARYSAKKVKNHYLEHAVMTSEIMVGLELASPAHRARLVPFKEILSASPRRTRELPQPDRWSVEATWGPRRRRYTLGLVPDRIFGLDFADEDDPPAFFFLEVDRGTMPVIRQQLHRTSFLKKLVGYHATWQAWQKKASPYGFKNFRVLTVTTTPEQADKRLANLVAAVQELASGHGLFLFTTQEALVRAEDPFSHAWVNGRGEEAFLTD